MTASLSGKLRQTLRALRAAREGNVAITFGLVMVPVIGLVGAAVDYSRANSARTQMQAALDSTALMLSREAPTLSAAQITQKANDYFNAMFTRPDALNKQLSVVYNAAGSSLTLTGSANVNTTLARVIGKTQMSIGTSAMVKWGNDRLRVALVLDNTGSMASAGKITALKTATTSLLAQLRSAALSNGDVYVSIIPFVNVVNVGAGNYNASWIDWTAWDAANGSNATTTTCSGNSGSSSGGGGWGGGGWGGGWGGGGGNCTTTTTWTPDNHNTWNGCVTDRGISTPPGTTAGYDQTVDAPVAGNAASLYPAATTSWCPQPIMGLTYDWTALNNLVNGMVANGTTNQPIGLVWGWQSLVGGGPLTAPPKDAGYTYQQFIILLSDGLNTQDRWYGNGSSTNTQVDARMLYPTSSTGAGTCKNIKDSGIVIYTVQVNTDGDPTSTLLQNCASTPDKFFMLTSSNQIVTTFNQIGTEIAKLRIAR